MAGDVSEPDFDLIQPRRANRGEIEGDVWVLLQPRLDVVGVVRGQVVQYDVDLLVRVRLDRLLEERQELGAVAGRGAVPEHLAGSHVQGCE